MSEGTREREMGWRIGAAGAVLHSLCRTVVMKRELSQKAKLSIYLSIFIPTLTYGHEGWVMTERTRSRKQSAEMGFLRRVAGISLMDRVRSSVIREGLGVEPLLLCIERSQLRWFWHLVRCYMVASLWRCSRYVQLGGGHGVDQGSGGGTISPHWPGNALGSPSQSWLMWPGKGKFGKPCWNCYLRDPTSDKRMKMDGWMDEVGGKQSKHTNSSDLISLAASKYLIFL